MSRKRITIKELAEDIGVSTATVSRAFSGRGRISVETRKFILEKAAELGYRPNANARNLILRRSDSLGYFYPSLIQGEPDYFLAEIILGLNEAALDIRMRLHLYPFPVGDGNVEETYKTLILDGTLEGVVIQSGTEESEALIKIAEEGSIPFIVIEDIEAPKAGVVGFDTASGAEEAGLYFRERGRKHPVFIAGLQDRRKIAGYRKGLGPLAECLHTDAGGSTFGDGEKAFGRIMGYGKEIDCVFCANDVIAIGFISEALKNGIKVPDDITVVGCDNVRFAQYYSPSLTTINIPGYSLGHKAARMLAAEIDGVKGYGRAELEVMKCGLVIRES